jgi:2-iminobutanoate/2-iminopropanoate deaminase
MRRVIGEKLPVPLSPAIQTERFVFVSGQVPTKDDGSVPEGIEAQTRLVMDKVKTLLEEAGSALDKVVKTTVFLTDVEDFQAFNTVYRGYFPDQPPARSCIRCDLMIDVKVEVEAIALR